MGKEKKMISWLKNAVRTGVSFGKKNAPSFMTGGSIALGWLAVYLFWGESREADRIIRDREEKNHEEAIVKAPPGEIDIPLEEILLSNKEKALIYLQCCWPSLALGLGSSGLAILAHKMDLSRLAEMYMLKQFLEDKNMDQSKLIDKLKGEVSEKKFKKFEEEVLEEKFPEESIGKGLIEETGHGSTLFISDVGNVKFRSSITDVQDGIYQFREMLRNRRNREIRAKLGDAFFVSSDNPYPDMDVYSSDNVDVFFQILGVKQATNLGDILEFRDYGEDDYLSFNQIMDYKKYTDPVTGVPAVCFLKIRDWLMPTHELIERNPR